MSVVRAAAKATCDPILKEIMEGSYDKLSHEVSMYFLSHEDLAQQLWKTHKQGAVFLLACGVAWQACVRKGFTKEWRDVQLNQLKVVIYSILGVKQDIGFDKRIMAAERTAGIVTNQLLDLMSWINARRQIHERIPLGVLSRMIETPLTTLHCESYFGTIANSAGSSVNPSASQIQERATQLDVAARIKGEIHSGFSVFSSRKQRKSNATTSWGFDGDMVSHTDQSDGWWDQLKKRVTRRIGKSFSIHELHAGPRSTLRSKARSRGGKKGGEGIWAWEKDGLNRNPVTTVRLFIFPV